MTFREKKVELCRILTDALLPMVTSDYWLLEVPHYNNVGDMLIWSGEMALLVNSPHKCKGMSSKETFRFPDIDPNDMILFQGGGNFGDIWTECQDFRTRVMMRYPRNKYLIFPQTVYFKDKKNLTAAASFFSNFNCTICARDERSFRLLTEHFENKILLLPDMAFCLKGVRSLKARKRRTLFLKRNDIECATSGIPKGLVLDGELMTSDWPMMKPHRKTLFERAMWHLLRLDVPRNRDRFVRCWYRPRLIREGERFLSGFSEVYTTRLHAAILRILMELPVTILDNSYGKNLGYYATWLKDCEGVRVLADE